MDSDSAEDFEPSFRAALKTGDDPPEFFGGFGNPFRSSHDPTRRAPATLRKDGIHIRSETHDREIDIPLDDIRQIEIVLLTVEPYWFLTTLIWFLPLMASRSMVRLIVGAERTAIDLRARYGDLAYATFVEVLVKRALTRNPKIPVVTHTASLPRIFSVFVVGFVFSFAVFGTRAIPIYLGVSVVVLLLSWLVRTRTRREATKIDDVFPYVV